MAQPEITQEIVDKVRQLQLEIDQLGTTLTTIEQQVNLLVRANESLSDCIATQEELKTKTPGDEILVPIGGSNYILCTVKDPEKSFVSLGSGVSHVMTRESSIERNKEQIANLDKSLKQLQQNYGQFSQMLEEKRANLLQLARQYNIG